jgi:hypothetical protein
VLDA